MDEHLFNAQYTGLAIGKLEAYGYLLDYNDAPANLTSSETFGARLSGAQAVNEDWKVIYTAEGKAAIKTAPWPNKITI